MTTGNNKVPRYSVQGLMADQAPRNGMTLVEVLTAIGVIGVLVGVSLPAVQHAREQSRQAACMNHLRQIGVAASAFEGMHGRFPPERIELVPAGPPPGVVVAHNPHPVSPHYHLLPHLDLNSLFQEIELAGDVWDMSAEPPTTSENGEALSEIVPVFLCPSDVRVAGATSYPEEPMPNSARDGFGRRGRGVRAGDVTDGLSQTAAFSERLLGDRERSRYDPSRDVAFIAPLKLRLPDEALQACERYVRPGTAHYSHTGVGWLFRNYGTTLYNHVLTPNSAIPDCAAGASGAAGAYSARSLHPGGVFVLFGDGAVRFISGSVDLHVWRGMGTINGGES